MKRKSLLFKRLAAYMTAAAMFSPGFTAFAEPEDEALTITGDDGTNIEQTVSDNGQDTGVDMSANDDETNETYSDDGSLYEARVDESEAQTVAEASSFPTKLLNGSFEIPAVYGRFTSGNTGGPWYDVTRSDFQTLMTSLDSTANADDFGWYTTACGTTDGSEGLIEFVAATDADGNLTTNSSKEKTIDECYANSTSSGVVGHQFAELNAEDQSSLYQIVSTTPGAILKWGFQHKGRVGTNGTSKGDATNDTMALFIGKNPSTTTGFEEKLRKPTKGAGDGQKDIFMWMAKLVKAAIKSNGDSVKEDGSVGYDVYSANLENIDLSSITSDNYTDYFSLTETSTINHRWTCWIVSDTVDAWGTYTGEYDVPDGQTETIFAFTALTGKISSNDYSINEGNLLDDVYFTAKYPLKVSSTGGGSGQVTTAYSSGDLVKGNEDGTVTRAEDFEANYADGTTVTLTATTAAANGDIEYSFVGAQMDNTFYQADNSKFTVTENSNGTYTYTFTEEMTAPRGIQLIFAAKSRVTYDPNTQGTYNGTYEDTMIKVASTATSDAVTSVTDDKDLVVGSEDGTATSENTRFIGWYFGRANTTNDSSVENNIGTGAIIASKNHEVTYAADADDSANDKLKVTYKLVTTDSETGQDGVGNTEITTYVPASTGVTFVARYSYLQQAIVVLKDTTDTQYQTGAAGEGGTVTVSFYSDNKESDKTKILRADNFGRLADLVLMEATAADGYTFMGWYTAANGGTRVSASDAYSYGIDGPETVYARFSKKLQYPYMSFVAEDNSTATTLKNTPFVYGSHIRVGNQIVSTYNGKNIAASVTSSDDKAISKGHYGDTVYGNTISTGFVANMSSDQASSLVKNYCLWTIEIPVSATSDSLANGDTYIKASSNSAISAGDYTINLADTAILTDSNASMDYNSGAIYKVESIKKGDTDANLVLTIYDSLPATVTGGIAVTYGIIIDNLYAPGATATITYDDISSTDATYDASSTDAYNTQIHASTIDEYEGHEGGSSTNTDHTNPYPADTTDTE